MKMLIIILFTCLMQVSASSLAQRITLSEKKADLVQVLHKIKQQAGIKMVYADELMKNSKKISLQFRDLPLEAALEQVFKDQPLLYEVQDKTLIIKEKTPSFLERLAERWASIDVTGRVVDEKGNPLPGATVKVKGKNQMTKTNGEGEFRLTGVDEDAMIEVSFVGYKSMETKVAKDLRIIKMAILNGELKEVAINTGYESVKPERFVGAAAVLDSTLLARVTGIDLLSRLENQVSALLFNRAGGSTRLQLRGVSTIQGASDIAATTTVNPLIILDNFPYNGNLASINPNSIESISVLKDAVAFSVWGARAGNGVIVIKTKQGMKNTRTSINFSSNLLVLERPQLGYFNKMNSSDFIDVEQFLFAKGHYDATFRSPQFAVVTPVVEILNKRKNGLISEQEAQTMINDMRNHSVIDDYNRHVLRNGVQIQNFLSITGGGQKIGYNLSIGADNNKSSIKGPGGRDRYTLNADVTFEPMKKLNVTGKLLFFDDHTFSDGPGYQISPGAGKSELYPYARLADENGMHLATPSRYIPGYVDTVGMGRLLDWKYRPLDENEFANGKVKTQLIQVNAAASYQILPWLTSQVTFQLGKQSVDTRTLYDLRTFFTRDIINRFTNPSTFRQVVPLGGILDRGQRILTNQNFRAQLNLSKQIGLHEIKGLVAGEISNAILDDNRNRTYGYDGENLTYSNNLNYADLIPLFITGTARIDNPMTMASKTDRFVSLVSNVYYTYASKYSIYASARKDGSNILGANTNNRWKPLWSAGGRWNIQNESFLQVPWIDVLALRATYGYAGNVNNTISAISTITHSSSANIFGQRVSQIGTLSNPDLRWEEVRTTNLGVDFGVLKNRISGSVEIYKKHSKDLISSVNVDQTLGVSILTKNVANIKGEGVELSLNTRNIDGAVKWKTMLNYSYAKSIVSEYFGNEITTPTTAAVRKGQIMGVLYAYKWAGLNPETGVARGYLKGRVSEDYSGIFADSASNQKLIGPSFPLNYGNIINQISYKQFSFSFNISFKYNYYFRKPSIRYDRLFIGWVGHSDYQLRWQKKGDEMITNVPSMQYPINANRDAFYENSEINIEKGDHVRLQDIRLSYNWAIRRPSKNHLKSAEFYVYANSLNVFLWRAAKSNYDPDYPAAQIPALRNLSFGVRLSL